VTIEQALSRAREILTANNIEDASLECEILLRYALKISRVQLYLDLYHELSPKQEENFWSLITRRANHEPTAYITRHCEFYGFDFYVDHRVLIPRSGSELLVDQTLKLMLKHSIKKRRPCLIAEVGTGSGAIAISIARHLPQVKIYASDISAPALEVAAINCQKHQVANRIDLLLGNMLEPLLKPVDLIVANLPYIKESEMNELSPEIQVFEPRLALAGGEDGLAKIHQLLTQARGKLRARGSMLLELGDGQISETASLARHYFPHAEVEAVPDILGVSRVLKVLN
jgi:release factor glutamine methyltransferase